MALVEFAEKELREAGWFDADADYGGLVGPAVLKMVEQFAEEGHSGYSAHLCLHLFSRVAAFKPLNPLRNPMENGEYIDHTSISSGHPAYQSTRRSSVFSEDRGKTWYDLDLKPPKWKRILAKVLPLSGRVYITFPYKPA